MKPIINTHYTEQEHKQAIKLAAAHLFSRSALKQRRAFKYDRRTRVGCLASLYVRKYAHLADNSVMSKQIQRAKQKPTEYSNILSSPIVKDWKANKGYLKNITRTKLEFYGRNHHAKSEIDFKILDVLIKYAKIA